MLKVVWKCKEPGIAKTILRRNNGDGGLILLDFKKQYNFIVIKLVQYWQKDREADQTKSIEIAEINPHRLKIINLKAKAKMLIHLGKFEENFFANLTQANTSQETEITKYKKKMTTQILFKLKRSVHWRHH